MKPGEYILDKNEIICNADKDAIEITVKNNGLRPIQVGSHFHFYEVNKVLEFDRELAYGRRLDIAGGTAVRFEGNEEKTINLIPIGGERKVYGMNNKIDGKLDR